MLLKIMRVKTIEGTKISLSPSKGKKEIDDIAEEF